VKHTRFGRSRIPMHHAVKQLSPLSAGGAFAPDADPPRRMAGGASLGRVRPLAFFVALAGTASFGSDAVRQLPAPWIDLRRLLASQTCENQAPTR